LFVLWVLHTPRAATPPGRYQSPPLEIREVVAFLECFAAFLENDARSDVWVLSQEPATIVYENHDLIYAYGPLDRFERVLRNRGFESGKISIPSPHAHNDHAEFDSAEKAVAGALDWRVTPLQPEMNRLMAF
jgi:hypothetical protein